MRYRSLGRTGLEVSEIGFGGFAIGGYDYGPTDDGESIAALEKACELGVTFFDTADMYGDGRSERLIGCVLKARNPTAVVATKVGFVGARHAQGGTPKDFSRPHILASAERSLRRLQREAIDLYQLHNPTLADLESGEAFQAMDDLVSAGKVRFWGVSAGTRDTVAVCRRAMAWPSAASMQLVANLLHHADLDELQPQIAACGMGVVARAPLEYGMLTGKFSGGPRFAAGDHRDRRWDPDSFSRQRSLVEALRGAFQDGPFTLAQLAIGFPLSYPEASVVICGAKRPSQVEENVATSELLRSATLTEGDLGRAREVVDSRDTESRAVP